MTRRVASWLAVAMIGAAAFVYGAVDEGEPRTDSDRAYAISNTIGCPVCQGQSVVESNAPIAKSIRETIALRIDAGWTDAQIRAELRDSYGEDVDYTPSSEGITILVWILPVVAFAGAVAGLVVVFRKWKREGDLEASAADRKLVEAARALADED
ncbi:MAG: cytochrome c-type biogenesis protein CcmH [Acidimicrobiales bacterium]|nr:cytochrome c-type biogenesis protein CcmH [Acidimicrobiales bacterium]